MVAGPPLVSLAAAGALGRARDGAALRWMLAHPQAFGHRSPRALGAALQSFGRGATPLLLAAIERGLADPVMERAVLDALGLAHCAAVVPVAAARLEHPWRDVRVAAARALGRLGAADRSVDLVIALRDPEWQVRAQAAHALGLVGAVGAIPALRAALRDRAWWVRRHSAYALARLGEAGLSALREAAASDSDRYARDVAAEALAGGFPAARPARRSAS
jgi:HEAT repeat protein